MKAEQGEKARDHSEVMFGDKLEWAIRNEPNKEVDTKSKCKLQIKEHSQSYLVGVKILQVSQT